MNVHETKYGQRADWPAQWMRDVWTLRLYFRKSLHYLYYALIMQNINTNVAHLRRVYNNSNKMIVLTVNCAVSLFSLHNLGIIAHYFKAADARFYFA